MAIAMFPFDNISCLEDHEFVGIWNIAGGPQKLTGRLQYEQRGVSKIRFAVTPNSTYEEHWEAPEYTSITGNSHEFTVYIPRCRYTGLSNPRGTRDFIYIVDSTIFFFYHADFSEAPQWQYVSFRLKDFEHLLNISTEDFLINTEVKKKSPRRIVEPNQIRSSYKIDCGSISFTSYLRGEETFKEGLNYDLSTVATVKFREPASFSSSDEIVCSAYNAICLIANCRPQFEYMTILGDAHSKTEYSMSRIFAIPHWQYRDDWLSPNWALLKISLSDLSIQPELLNLAFHYVEAYPKYSKWAIGQALGGQPLDDKVGLLTVFMLEEYHRQILDPYATLYPESDFEKYKTAVLDSLPCGIPQKLLDRLSSFAVERLNELSLQRRLKGIRDFIGRPLVKMFIRKYDEFVGDVVDFRNSYAHGLAYGSPSGKSSLGKERFLQVNMLGGFNLQVQHRV